MEILESIVKFPGEAANHRISEDTQWLIQRKGEGKKPQH